MADFRLSPRAETDLAEIADYTIETFGVEQAPPVSLLDQPSQSEQT